jgi:alkylhydroperoxidase/carboxymuconolactone decarboxylase family protein YurZ
MLLLATAGEKQMAHDARPEAGMAVRRGVLGDDHVDAAVARTSDLDAPFQEYITGAAWADVWGRPGLPRATRSLITIAPLPVVGHEADPEMHLRAARRTDTSPEEIVETLLHVALHAGVPAANGAFSALRRVYREDDTTTDSEGDDA